jgi:hypothetical protein
MHIRLTIISKCHVVRAVHKKTSGIIINEGEYRDGKHEKGKNKGSSQS